MSTKQDNINHFQSTHTSTTNTTSLLSNRELKKKQAKQKHTITTNNKNISKILSDNLKKGKKLTAIDRTILDSKPDLVDKIKKNYTKRQQSLAKKKDKECEYIDEDEILLKYAKELAKVLYNCRENDKSVICYTGAGISTSANIRDYRGPNGVWTEINGRKNGSSGSTGSTGLSSQKLPDQDETNDIDESECSSKNSSLTQAKPTKAHMILKRLIDKNYINHILSQNCDGLHIRSGVPKEKLSEIHGNMYVERCANFDCTSEACFRIFDVTEKTNFRRHKTGRKCRSCGSQNSDQNSDLLDSIIHFGEISPEKQVYPYNWLAAYKTIYPWWDGKDSTWKTIIVKQNTKIIQKASKSKRKLGLILCLGTSLAVLKSYKHLWPKDFKNLVIVNLQYTPKDSFAKIKVHARCDEFLELVYKELHVLESCEWELPDLSEIERQNYYTPSDIPEYNLKEDQLLRLAEPIQNEELYSINTLSIYKPKRRHRNRAEANLTERNSEQPEKRTKIESSSPDTLGPDPDQNFQEIFTQLPLSPNPPFPDHTNAQSSTPSTSRSSTPLSHLSNTSKSEPLPYDQIPAKFLNIVQHIDGLEKPKIQPGWYGIGNKRKRGSQK